MKVNFEQRYYGTVAYVQIGDREVRSYGEDGDDEALAVLVQQLQEIVRDGKQAQQVLDEVLIR